MFRSVRIQNFRQFKDLELKNLGRINLITGQNNTGKTSLLEALWILVAGPVDPGVVQTAARIRGISQVEIHGPSAWGWIFRAHSKAESIVLESVRDDGKPEVLQIRRSNSVTLPLPDRPDSGSQFEVPTVSTADVSAQALKLVFTDTAAVEHEASLEIIGQEAIPRGVHGIASRNWYFLSNRHGAPEEEAQNFDRLVLAGFEDELLQAYRTIDQRVTGVRTLNPGSGQRIYISMEKGEFLPIDVMGHGFYRMGKIATAIIRASGGVAMIDEIDDGLHYLALQDVWRVAMNLAHRHDVQLFATTHSYECIQAAVAASSDMHAGLAMFRLTRLDGRIRVVDVDDEGLRDAVSLGFEMR